jgi:hypothetical protein
MERYSFKNRQRLREQLPGASDVRPMTEWNKAGRKVCRGEHALWVTAPSAYRFNTTTGRDEPIAFRQVPVFDISQTEEAVLTGSVHQDVA